MMARTKAHQLLMGALLGICLLSTLLTARAGNAALEKPKSNVEDWSKSAAPKEVSEDIKKLLKEYDSEKGTLSKIAKNFDKSRDKNGGIRKLGVWGITLSRTYHLPGVDNKKGIYQRMMDNADNIAGTYKEGHSYIEDANMRGWPMLVGAKDKKPSHEAFNAGKIPMMIISAHYDTFFPLKHGCKRPFFCFVFNCTFFSLSLSIYICSQGALPWLFALPRKPPPTTAMTRKEANTSARPLPGCGTAF